MPKPPEMPGQGVVGQTPPVTMPRHDGALPDRVAQMFEAARRLHGITTRAREAVSAVDTKSAGTLSTLLQHALPATSEDADLTLLAKLVGLESAAVWALRSGDWDALDVEPSLLARIGRELRLPWPAYRQVLERSYANRASPNDDVSFAQLIVPVALAWNELLRMDRTAQDDGGPTLSADDTPAEE